jgi:diguanylate cyclase (GGDEF)-like protein/PAS domain S-box-containing protein
MDNKLPENEEKLRGLFELSPLGIALTDMAGRYVEFNEAFRNICGYSAEELKALDYWTLTPRQYEADEARQLESLERTGHYGPYEKQYVRKDGRLIPLRLNGMLITGNDGQKYIWSIVEDISDRKRIEADLQVAATAFEAQVGIIVTDASTEILRVNQAFTEDTGYTAAEAVGRTPRMFKSGRHDAAFYAAMWESIRRTGAWQGEIWDRRKNGEIYPKWMTITAVKGPDGVASHYVGTQFDLTDRKAAEEEIRYLAFYDPLTRLPNRRLLLDRLHQALATSARRQRQGALLFIDLDNFKTLNDTLGHNLGDSLLQQVAQRLASCVREGDTVARLGGDEFVVILEDLDPAPNEAAAQAKAVGEKIRAALNRTYLLSGRDSHSTPSVGVALFGNKQETVEQMLKQADLAMYQAKSAGRNVVRFFDPKMQATVTARAGLEMDLRNAVHQEQFVVYYQVQVDGDGRSTGAEVLVRWQHPRRGMVLPGEFIPLAEETGLILPLGHWVLERACMQLAAWAPRTDMAHLSLAVNASVQQVRQPDFVEQVLAVLDRTGADPRKLTLELTESLLMSNAEDTIAKMSSLKAAGVGFALDDFGTGYSSLSYLKRLPLDCLKIDRSFVLDVLTDPNDAAIAKTIVALAHSLGLSVIAEGVETEEQRDFLAGNGCHVYQGFLFSRPLPLEEFERVLHRASRPATSL